MRELTLRIRHHGAPESDISARFPTLTIRTVSALIGGTANENEFTKLSGRKATSKRSLRR